VEINMRTLAMVILVLFSPISLATGGSILNALKSEQAGILAGDRGVYTIFVQTPDGTTVRNIQALNTFYFLSDQFKDTAPTADRTLIFKTDRRLHVLRYRLVDEPWLDAVPYSPPEDLPDIDFRKIQRIVKKESGHKPIASISIYFFLDASPNPPLMVDVQVKNDTDDSCDQSQYNVDKDEIANFVPGVLCFFDMDDSSGFSG
jgi:hypothetical protein